MFSNSYFSLLLINDQADDEELQDEPLQIR